MMSKTYRYTTWSYFTKNMLKKAKKIRPHCVKSEKCACTAPNAKKCGTCGKTKKVRDFYAAHNRIFPQGVSKVMYNITYTCNCHYLFYMYSDICTHMRALTQAHIYTHKLTHTYAHIHTYSYTYARIHAQIDAHKYT